MKPRYKASTDDQNAEARPSYVIESWDKKHPSPGQQTFRRVMRSGCLVFFTMFICIAFIGAVYFLVPFRTDFLILGIDRSPDGTDLGRSDTNILVTVRPLRPYIGALSIPRDLWVTIPSVGENRINTAHYFAEAENPGSGPDAALETINQNFGLSVNHYVRLKFDGIVGIVDALGGLDVELENPMGGLPAGQHKLSGEQALVFVRDRQGTDDFFRMLQGQFFMVELIEQLLQPSSWLRMPAFIAAVSESLDTSIPFWVWPRLGFALLRLGPGGIDYHVINRDYVSPTITSDGAQVLLPEWTLILPLADEIFGN
jgi:LCP family protein required for cell wall assembly